jgi:hypothetical protein
LQISTRFGFSFLCNPKCASTSIEQVLSEYSNINFWGHSQVKHIDVRKYNRFIVPLLNQALPNVSLTSFCMVRNPIDVLKSWYRYRMRESLSDPSHIWHNVYTGNISFNRFIEGILDTNSTPPYASIPSISEFMTEENGRIGLDLVFCVENMELLEEFLSLKLSKNITIPRLNKSIEAACDLDSDLEKELYIALRDDFRVFEFIKSKGYLKTSEHQDELSLFLKNES